MTSKEFKTARNQLGFTVREMATELGLIMPNGERNVRRWESGEVEVSGLVEVAVRGLLAVNGIVD